MDRRIFVQNASFIVAGSVFMPRVLGAQSLKKEVPKLTILHTNDTHSNIDPMPANHAQYPNMGGAARRHKLIQEIRSKEEHVLLLDSGDVFQGTPYFNKYKGVLEMKLMSEMGYQGCTLGNHDFDIGLDGFVNAQKFANFPFICSNYNFDNTPLQGGTIPYKLFDYPDFRVGVFALGIKPDGLIPKELFGATQYFDPIAKSKEMVKILRDEKCDFIICLSHLGYEYAQVDQVSDKALAANTEGIDLIIGAHTHTFLKTPSVFSNSNLNQMLVNQVGWGGINLGRIDVFFDSKRREQHSLISVGPK
jgi:5'-nucleotidase